MQNNSDVSVHFSGGIYFFLKGRSVLKKFILENRVGIVFIDIFTTNNFHRKSLSHDAQKMCEHGTNAGGRSEISEAISFEAFYGCQGATLEKTEKEIEKYLNGGPLIDFVCNIFGINVGVSVTRAMKYNGKLEEKEAEDFLKRKLKGAKAALETNLKKENPPMWRRQILHVWVKNKEAGNIVYKVIKELPDEEVSDILVVISIAKISDFIFTNKINDRYPPEVQHLKEILKFLEKDSPAGIFLSEHIKCLLKRKN